MGKYSDIIYITNVTPKYLYFTLRSYNVKLPLNNQVYKSKKWFFRARLSTDTIRFEWSRDGEHWDYEYLHLPNMLLRKFRNSYSLTKSFLDYLEITIPLNTIVN